MVDDEVQEAPDGTEVPKADADKSAPWLALITEAEKAFEDYNTRCDNIDRLYANLNRLANTNRDREMSLFWANIQTLGPSIYSRPPVPVIMPRFKDQRQVPRVASELLERSAVVSFETSKIDRTLRLVRDDLARLSRGVVWQRYEKKDKSNNTLTEKVCNEFKFRRDFTHDPARCWAEVDWVAAASYLTKDAMKERFEKHSGDAYKNVEYAVRKDPNDNKTDGRLKAKVWELWSKSEDKVVWIAEGTEEALESAKPHLTLEDFFPCPEPAYGTLQPESLIPVPDMLQYKDQLEEINELTARVAALSESVKVRGFYPAGAGEIGDAIEAAIKSGTNNQVLVPVSNWAMLGNGSPNDMIVWLPLEMIVNTISQLIELRRQLIQDVYEISGISDILRGSTNPNETLGAQELKAQTGSTRIRDKQEEIVRLARDITRNTAEIMAEEFATKTLLDMSQMVIPTDAEIAKQVKDLTAQGVRLKAAVEAEMAKPEVQQQAQEKPDEAKAAMQEAEQKAQQLQGQIKKLQETVTIEQVMKLLKDQKLRPFILDIETDSTITPDENAQKQRATEYVTAMASLFQQALPMVQQVPQAAPLMAQTINWVNSQFRVGREFATVVEEFTEQMKQLAAAPKNEGPSPEQIKAQADAQSAQLAGQKMQMDGQAAQADAQLAAKDLELRQQVALADHQLAQQAAQSADALAQAKLQGEGAAKAAQIEADKWKAELDAVTKIKVAMISAKTDQEKLSLEAELESLLGIQLHHQEIERMQIDHAHQADMQDGAQAAAAQQNERQIQAKSEQVGA